MLFIVIPDIAPVSARPAPAKEAELPETVALVSVAVPVLLIPPPERAEFIAIVLLTTLSVPAF